MAATDLFADEEFTDAHVSAGKSPHDEERDDDDEVAKQLLRALSCYRQGQYKGAVRNAANAITTICGRHRINGGAFY